MQSNTTIYGPGAGRRNGPYRAGPGGDCVCPNCGYIQPHNRGNPCTDNVCPECNTSLVRKDVQKVIQEGAMAQYFSKKEKEVVLSKLTSISAKKKPAKKAAGFKKPAVKTIMETFNSALSMLPECGSGGTAPVCKACRSFGTSMGTSGLPLPKKTLIDKFDERSKKVGLALEKRVVELKDENTKDPAIKVINKLVSTLKDKNKIKEFKKYLKTLGKGEEAAMETLKTFSKALKAPQGFKKKIITDRRNFNVIIQNDSYRLTIRTSWEGEDSMVFSANIINKKTDALMGPQIVGNIEDYEDPATVVTNLMKWAEESKEDKTEFKVDKVTYVVTSTKLESMKKKLKKKGSVILPPKGMGVGFKLTTDKVKGADAAPAALKKIFDVPKLFIAPAETKEK